VTAHDVLTLALGLLQLVLAVVVLRHLGRFGRAFPWLAALMAFFAIRGGWRVYTVLADGGAEGLALATDLIAIGVLVLLIAGLGRTVRGLRLAQEGAEYRESEYARALGDYRALARHRLANPLAAILGGVATLQARPDLGPDDRARILEAVEGAAQTLERIALDPVVADPEERSLSPAPNPSPTASP
jgi:signal transduction histidine kinase